MGPVALSRALMLMARFGGILRDVLVWTYSRGTIPYDIICGLIILFIFLTPRSCFIRKPVAPDAHHSAYQESSGAVHAATQPAAGLARK